MSPLSTNMYFFNFLLTKCFFLFQNQKLSFSLVTLREALRRLLKTQPYSRPQVAGHLLSLFPYLSGEGDTDQCPRIR